MSLTGKGKDAVAQLVARFVFDDAAPAASQEALARHIEAAIAEFKTTQMQDIIAQTLRDALTRRIAEAIESWSRSNHPPQPYVPEPEPRRRRSTKAPKPEMDAAA